MEVMGVNAKDAVGEVVSRSGEGPMALSRKLGRHESYLSTTISRRSVPKLDTFADIADACGFELVLRGHGTELVIEPNQRVAIEYRGEC